MTNNGAGFRLWVFGPFRLEGPNGIRIEISSKRGQALIAMLAIAGGGERSRGWLQDRLWGSRAAEQATASLRRELSNLRQIINQDHNELIYSAHGRVWIDLDKLEVDCRSLSHPPTGELLEGIDISGEEMFEDWLREERARFSLSATPAANPSQPVSNPTPASADPFAQRPAIAVLPFSWIPASAENEATAQGISEDLIDRLSKLRWLPIIARSSSFALPTAQHDPRTAGTLLSARYIVDGAIRDGTLSVSLNDAQTGQCLWNGRSPLPCFTDANSLETVEDLLTGITATLGFRIDLSEQQRALQKVQSELSVRELIWRGRWHLNRLTPKDAVKARECFDKALSIEPNSSEALIQSTWARLWDLWAMRGAEDEIRAVRKMAQQAIVADYDDARGHMLAGIAEIWLRQPLRAEALLSRAIELNPSLVMAHTQLGCALHLKGDHKGAIDALRTAIRLSPNDQDLFFMKGELAVALLFEDQCERALVEAEESISRRGAYWLAHVVKIVALVKLGRSDAAHSAFTDLQTSNSGFREAYLDWLPFIDSAKRDFLKDGLNLARSSAD